MGQLLKRVQAASALEAAAIFALGWRGWMAVSGLGTLFFVGRLLSPTEQGYYFTFESLTNFRVVAELGLSQVIVQVASHELAHLRWTADGVLTGSDAALGKIASLLRAAFSWYVFLAVAMLVGLSVGGTIFFSGGATSGVRWTLPWIMLSVVIAGQFFVMPVIAFFEGLGQVTRVMRLRLIDVVSSNLVLWTSLRLGAGLWALSLFYLTSLLVQSTWIIATQHRALRGILAVPQGSHPDFWRSEVLPFQWRLGVSWVSGYLMFYLLNPLVFRISGPVEAGRLGMSLVAAQGVLSVGNSIMRAKAPTLGRLIAAREWRTLQETWRRGLVQTLVLTASGSLMIPLAGFVLESQFPEFARRILPSHLLAVLAVATVINGVTQAVAVYLRAYREEPLMWASLGAAVISLPVNILGLRFFGPAGICLGFLMVAMLNCLWTLRVQAQRMALRTNTGVFVEGASTAL